MVSTAQRLADGLWNAQASCLSCARGPRCAQCVHTMAAIRLLLGCLRIVAGPISPWTADEAQYAGKA